jgi:hypothetical protein
MLNPDSGDESASSSMAATVHHQPEAATTQVDDLPEACLAQVIALTSPRDAVVCAAVSPAFRAAADSDRVWRSFVPADLMPLHPSSTRGAAAARRRPTSASATPRTPPPVTTGVQGVAGAGQRRQVLRGAGEAVEPPVGRRRLQLEVDAAPAIQVRSAPFDHLVLLFLAP